MLVRMESEKDAFWFLSWIDLGESIWIQLEECCVGLGCGCVASEYVELVQ